MDHENNAGAQRGGSDDESIVNWVALVVSLVALLGTFAQVLQQYIASAAGYSNCGESVMGLWHLSKRRKFRPTELRFEVLFETPVIFVCPPGNTKGPIPNKAIYFVDGTPESLVNTRALLPEKPGETQRRQSQVESRVHTADNERASWVTLLSQLHVMEKESSEWQQQHYNSGPPLRLPPISFRDHTLAVALQAKTRSWDTMPAGVKKPYATTTMCHLIEIAAMMGIYWKEFDRSNDRYRAEGNGYMLMGTQVPDLGIMFTLQITGRNKFRENRVIPVDEVKELCCGYVSTLFQRDDKDRRRIEFPNEDPKDLGYLQLGSRDEVAETMVLIGCNTDTANYFRSDDAKHGHLFPVPFELVGMLGKTLHIAGSAFRMLPNPTPYHWDKKFFDLRRLVREYWKKIKDPDTDLVPVEQVADLKSDAQLLVRTLDRDKTSNTPGYSMPLLNTLHDILDRCDAFLKSSNGDLLRMVIREHFQEVLRMLNDKGGGESRGGRRGDGGVDGRTAQRFDELSAASPELRQEAFMELYFYKVLRQVRERAVISYQRQHTTTYAPSTHSREPSVDNSSTGTANAGAAAPSVSVTPVSPTPSPPASPSASRPLSPERPEHAHLPHGLDATSSLDAQASAIWCTLVLRMLCWLLLHDFHKKDVQIPKSDLLGSRLPVYIA